MSGAIRNELHATVMTVPWRRRGLIVMVVMMMLVVLVAAIITRRIYVAPG
jgi:hypothetical protein